MKKFFLFLILIFNLSFVQAQEELFEPIYLDLNNNKIINENPYSFNPTIKLQIEKRAINTNLKPDHVKDLEIREFLKRFQENSISSPNILNINRYDEYNEGTVYFGKNPLDKLNTSDFTFISEKSNDYNVGVQMASNTELFNYSFALSNSTLNRHNEAAFSITTKNNLLKSKNANLKLGAGYYQNDMAEGETTSGVFGQYAYKKLSFTAQIATTKYQGLNSYSATSYFSPEFKINQSVSINYKHRQDFDGLKIKDSFGLRYRPKILSDRNLLFKLDAININEKNLRPRQQLNFSTEFKI